ncbi:hypothetical protein H0B56_14410 [Haloechinothrix sp. YIM 98757]|uniref:Transposase n=1 Tax=Haloechinothrix aidingensis TaxID=2752311 RepID=A0A838ABX0_9PSEU|nr:transposase [Haloechinothrix aidingensis]MBA0126740.1 hypothetical protein [Haloechinothrix aidingensis]
MVTIMSKRYPPEVREKAVRLVLDRLDEYGSAYAAARAIGPLVDMHHETLRLWIKKALAAGELAGEPTVSGLSSVEREELQRLRKENRNLKQTNEILKLASSSSRGNSTCDIADRRVHRRIPSGLWRRVDLPRIARARDADHATDLPQGPPSAGLGPWHHGRAGLNCPA